MSIRIGTNISSLGAQRRLSETTSSLERTFERLSSGMRINRASDDAAGLAIATSLNANSRVYAQGIRNLNDGISALSIAGGAINALSSVTTRMLELSAQSANGSYSSSQRQSLNNEVQSLIQEYNRITNSTTFNGRQLLDGSMRDLFIQAGGDQLRVGIGQGSSRLVGTGLFDFLGNVTFSTGTGGVQFGDINNDGIQDMVLGAGGASGDVRFALGNGDGTFRAETSFTQFFSSRIELADVNNDGNIDIIGIGNGSGQLLVSLGNGNGTFSAAITHTVSSSLPGGSNNLRGISFGDFNGDGILDVAAVSDNSVTSANDRLFISFGVGNGTFNQGVSFNVGDMSTSSRISIGDIDGDGRVDLMVNANGANNHIILNNGNGTFRSPVTIATGASSGGNGSFLADLNNDGVLDIMTAVTNPAGNISIQLGNGDGTFRSSSFIRTSLDNNPFRIGDMNGDGIVDIVSYSTTGNFTINLGNGDGTFRSPVTRSSTFGGTITLSDLNRDGVQEVIVLGVAGNNMSIYSPQTTTSGNIENFNILTQSSARSALDFLRTVQQRLAQENAWLGAYQSRINTATQNLITRRENYLAAEGRITNADIAEESAELTRKQILQNIGASVLAQANIQPNIALRLLNGGRR